MVDLDPQGLDPRLFVCPVAPETPAARREDGTFELTEGTCSYEVPPPRTALAAAARILFHDKRPHHGGGRARRVAFSDGSVGFLPEDEFQKLRRAALVSPSPAPAR